MARAKANKLYNTFVKGLITEASELTYPEGASIEEDNCIIFRKGNRSRRLGIDFEEGWEPSNFFLSSTVVDHENYQPLDVAISEYHWSNVGGTNNNFLVFQQGRYVQFYDLATSPISGRNFFLDLNNFLAPGQTDTSKSEITMTTGKGFLFVAGERIDPFVVEYNAATDTITATRIYIQIRDFLGVYDGLANDEEPTSLSDAHNYNLKNQGWVDSFYSSGLTQVQYYDEYTGEISYYTIDTSSGFSPISQYFTSQSRYPGNNKQWWAGKDTDGVFDPALLDKFYSGNTRAPKGHYIVNAFHIDRSGVSGVPNLAVESISTRPNTIAFFSGRVWYGLNSTVYYSQILDDKRKAGLCFQEADPTAEDISDLIPTDGGVIQIPEMGRINRLYPIGAGVLCFANNGIWYITGTSAGFSATDISVSKVSPVGTESPNSIVEVDTHIYWWSKTGIQAMSQKSGMFGPIDGQFDRTNISEVTIQSFFNEISANSKRYVKGVYDPATNVIQWLFKTEGLEDIGNNYFYDRILNFDLSLQAFYPWTITSPGPYVCGVFTTPRINEIANTENVVVDGVQLVDEDEEIVENEFVVSVRSTLVKYLIVTPDEDGYYRFTFGLFNNTDFVDWYQFGGSGAEDYPYNSYVLTGYELLDDAMRKKQTPFVYCFFRRTETAFNQTDDGDFILNRPSSCLFQVRWDWADSVNSNKWSRQVEVYRHRRLPSFNESDLDFDTGFAIVVSRNKVRGSGRAIQFRFGCDEPRKNFDLLGWSVQFTGNTEP